MTKWLLSLILALSLSSTCVAAENTITAAADPWPPFADPDHPQQGLSIEIVTAAFENQGYTLKMNFVPWARALDGVQKGTYDICPTIWLTEERKKTFVFSSPYTANKIKFIKNKGDAFEFDTIESLSGKTVGVIRGYSYGADFIEAANFKKEAVNKLEINIKKLVENRIDLTLEDEIVAKDMIKQKFPELTDKLEFTKNALSENNLYIATSLTNPNHQQIIEAFNKGLQAIKDNGTYEKILSSYGIEK